MSRPVIERLQDNLIGVLYQLKERIKTAESNELLIITECIEDITHAIAKLEGIELWKIGK